MGIKKNFAYNAFLTASNFIFPILVFPYVSRVLGVSNIGLFNFVDNIINYFILISMLGVSATGIREVSKNKNDYKKLQNVFSSLFVLNTICTGIVLLFLIIATVFVPKLTENWNLMFLGGVKLIFNLFLIEWFFKGIEDFKYISIRNLIIKILYTVAIFCFVKHKNDYTIYYFITVLTVFINALTNWVYSRKFVTFAFSEIEIRPYIRPFLILGFYLLLNSLYSTFNIIYLGFVAGDKEVGFYSTALKLFGVSLAFFSAFTGVMMPRISSLIADNNLSEVNRLLIKSCDLLFVFCLPMIIFCVFFAPEIISLMAGPGYEGAILPMRMAMPMLLIIGIEQILILQLLVPLKKDKEVFINSLVGAIVGISLGFFMIRTYQSVGSVFVLVCEEFSILLIASYFVKQKVGIVLPYKNIFLKIIYSIPYIVINFLIIRFDLSDLVNLIIALLFNGIYFFVSEIFLFKNRFILDFIRDFKK